MVSSVICGSLRCFWSSRAQECEQTLVASLRAWSRGRSTCDLRRPVTKAAREVGARGPRRGIAAVYVSNDFKILVRKLPENRRMNRLGNLFVCDGIPLRTAVQNHPDLVSRVTLTHKIVQVARDVPQRCHLRHRDHVDLIGAQQRLQISFA